MTDGPARLGHAVGLAAGQAWDICKIEELSARIGKTTTLQRGGGILLLGIKLFGTAIGIRPQYAGPCREMRLRVLAASIERIVK